MSAAGKMAIKEQCDDDGNDVVVDDEVEIHTKSVSNGIGESSEITSIEWKKKVKSFKTRFPVKRKNSAEETYEMNRKFNNDLQEMCCAWMDKVARINDPPNLKKHAGEVGDNIRMVKCNDSGNSPSFSNNIMNIKVKRVQMNKRKVRVEL
ncbi:6942_t:CDS:2 [Dentiscutata erythropus]|uniref:6942_t:CDS:1 n=1 Tax=Dentiscutata erythropus TaxID=1348616 RepID=A0A9N9JJQ4_9GLOM|nr:6942_t:CDS:2 [Dentiscutata erythropus]